MVFCLLLTIFYSLLSVVTKSTPDVLFYLVRIVSLRGVDSLWFIPVFFFAELLFVLLLIPKKLGKWLRLLTLIIGVLCAGINVKNDSYLISFVIRLFICNIFVYSGFLFSKIQIVKVNVIIPFLFIACGIPLAIYNGPIGLATLQLGDGWIFMLTALINCFGFVLLFYYLEQKGLRLGLLELFGKNSIVILCTNNLLIEIVRLMDSKLTNNWLLYSGVIGSIIFTIILIIIEIGIIKLTRFKFVSFLFGKRQRRRA